MTPDILLTLTGDSGDTVPALITVRIDSASHREDRLRVPPTPRGSDFGELRIHELPEKGRRSTHLRIEKPQLTIDGRLHCPLVLSASIGWIPERRGSSGVSVTRGPAHP